MPQVYSVIACTGEYDNWSRREVATFVEKAVAEKLAQDAQAVADQILARGTGVGDKGQNPHDLLMKIDDDVISYSVRSHKVLDEPHCDPAENSSQLGPVTDHFDFSDRGCFWNPVMVEQNLGPRELTGELFDAYHNEQEVAERAPVLLREVNYRNLSFGLYLCSQLAAQRWNDEDRYNTRLLYLKDLSPEELDESLETGKAPAMLYATTEPQLTWKCSQLEGSFVEDLRLVPADPQECAKQLIRIFEAWLLGAEGKRQNRADFDQLLSGLGL